MSNSSTRISLPSRMPFVMALKGVILCLFLYVKRFIHRHVVKPRVADSSVHADMTLLSYGARIC
jgi:hypothetical protein